MGDGGVACMPSQHVVERLPYYNKGNVIGNNAFSTLKIQRKLAVVEDNMDNAVDNEVETGEIEVEEGEVAPGNAETIIFEKYKRREAETGRWRERDRERGEFVPEKRQKWGAELEKGEFVPPDKWKKREVNVDKSDYGSAARRTQRGELERGEFVPPYKSTKALKSSYIDRDEDGYQRKPRWESGNNNRDEVGGFKRDANDGKSYSGKDYSSQSWLKRQSTDLGNNARRYNGDFTDNSNSKSRRIYEDNNGSGYMEKHHSHSSVDRYRNVSSSRTPNSSRYLSKNHESPVPRRALDRLGPNPAYFDRSGNDRARHHDHHDRSPVSERSPNDQARYSDHRNRSPVRKSPPHRSRQYDRRDRSPGYLDKSPHGRGRSPHVRGRHQDNRDRTPGYLENSPVDNSRYSRHDRERTPGYLDRSPLDCDLSPYHQTRYRNCRDRTPGHLEGSPLDRGHPHDYQENSRARKRREEEHISVGERDGDNKLRPGRKVSDPPVSTPEQQLNDSVKNDCGPLDTDLNDQSHKEDKQQIRSTDCADPTQISEVVEEISMEEDMDISNTPPHVSFVNELDVGNWFYLDHYGMERGPSKLYNLKRLVEDGVLQSDHLIKHSGSDWWMTIENASSPLVVTNLSSIVSETVSQLVSPPEASGNLLEDAGDAGEFASDQEPSVASHQLQSLSDGSSKAEEYLEDLHIDDRINVLLQGSAIIPGRELETLGEALQMEFEHTDWENWDNSEGFTKSRPCILDSYGRRRDEESNKSLESKSKEVVEVRTLASCNKDKALLSCNSSHWFSGRWSCKGGDWKRNDDVNHEKSSRRKYVLNDGYPLCQMPKSGHEDPRWCRRDELYCPQRKKLNLPSWAFSLTEERNDVNGNSKTSQLKTPLGPRGVKGAVLPVVRINACVVNNQASHVPEPRIIGRCNERHSSRSSRSFSSGNDERSLSAEGVSRSKCLGEQKCVLPIITPKGRVCTADELQLDLGDWYYFDGAGHEHGPSSSIELQGLIQNGTIQKNTSVFRKFDNIWVPVDYFSRKAKLSADSQDQEIAAVSDSSASQPSQSGESVHDGAHVYSNSFHNVHPQFIGYTRGKLHELVMKSYKSREFASAINEVLDPWINTKQPKKELELMQKFRKSEDDHIRAVKRARFDESDDECDMEGGVHGGLKDDYTFDNLCGDATFGHKLDTGSVPNMESWGLLNGSVLARIFHFLRADLKSLAFSASTCRHWKSAVKFYKDISKQVDLSEAGPDCSDSMFRRIMNHYNNSKIASIILIGCTNISANALEEILLSFPCISSIDVRGCIQFRELTQRYQNIRWISSRSLRDTRNPGDSSSKTKSLKQLSEKGHSSYKAFKGSSSYVNEFSERDYLQHDSYLDGRESSSRPFQQSSYKRKKLVDPRKSSSALSRSAQIRQWFYRKSQNGYKRIEAFLALSLKDIMKENTFDYFVTKVAQIEDKMKSGYYSGRGLSSVKDDIRRMCRDAIKAKKKGHKDMNHIVMLFIHLATSLEEIAIKTPRERDELLKMLKEKTKRKQPRLMNDRKSTSRRNGTVYSNGSTDHGEYTSDKEIRKGLHILKPSNSESESSAESSQASGDSEDDSESTISDTESTFDHRSDGGVRDGYFMDEDEESTTEEREWGARMTKASLVPPVTRKYEVIDQYVIIAEEEEVQRKMQVALPEDYQEKLNAQKDGAEDSDTALPEVKDYKPRKELGVEVLEQEVYGIDPYTHNLLLDSMPEDPDWPLSEKHVFIEDTLLRALNMQVRHFTGTGNAPMKYSLQSVVEELLETAEKDGDKHILRMCQAILKAMQRRTEDNYVAYRKGLGVVCNKEGGFGEDDFVVEFLGEVYPVWKWFEKQDGIRELQKNSKDPAPEFYNIYLERPKGDRDGYDLVVVDAMHKANYASRICHSCHPNCEAKVTAVDGQYQIGVYTVRPIGYAEEVTFDYNSVTESKEEYEQSVCLCGSHICRGSFLNLTGEGAYQKIIMESHGVLDRHQLMLEACESNFVSEGDYIDLGRAGLGTCLLSGLPVWLVAYSARLVRFINFERTKLPEEILRHNLEDKRKYGIDTCLEVEKNDAEVQAEGVYNQRLQNLAVTLDKVRYVMRSVYRDPQQAPAPLKKLSPEEIVSVIWTGEGSLVEELLECMAPHTEASLFDHLKSSIRRHDPTGSDNLMGELRKSLLWLRDTVRDLPCTYKCRHDAAADVLHVYAYTQCFFRVQEYKAITSPPVYISPLDVGPKYAEKLGSGPKEYCKKYGENYCLGQLIYWHSLDNADPDHCLLEARKGCLLLPEMASFYTKVNKPTRQPVYGPKVLKAMLQSMEKKPQKAWPKEKLWSFKSSSRVLGSPMLDAVVNKTPLNKEMLQWLKTRTPKFEAKWDK